ncbi:MAG: leucine-rich repeat domain-containing protein [Oscillospiraceae bacterium]
MKKFILILLTLIILSACTAKPTSDEEFTTPIEASLTSESTAENTNATETIGQLEYQSNGNGTCTVVGIGTYTDSHLVIPSKSPDGDIVTHIGIDAFEKNEVITAVSIPDTVISIGYGSFFQCKLLEDVDLPDSVSEIGSYAFGSCYKIESIDIPESVKCIGDGAFMHCENLGKISAPESVEEIGNLAFFETLFWREHPEDFLVVGNGILINYKGTSKEVVIPDNVKYITESFGYMEYRNHIIEKIIVPETVEGYGEYAFAGCENLKEIVLPDNMKYIPDAALYSCPSLEKVIIPDGVESIGRSAFDGCSSLESIVIPKSVTEMGETVFNHTDNITVYCEAESKPEGWDDEWDTLYLEGDNDKVNVVWGYDITKN